MLRLQGSTPIHRSTTTKCATCQKTKAAPITCRHTTILVQFLISYYRFVGDELTLMMISAFLNHQPELIDLLQHLCKVNNQKKNYFHCHEVKNKFILCITSSSTATNDNDVKFHIICYLIRGQHRQSFRYIFIISFVLRLQVVIMHCLTQNIGVSSIRRKKRQC